MFRKTRTRGSNLMTSAATYSGEFRRVIPAKVEPLDPATAGKLKRFERVEVNALHPTESNLERELAILSCRSPAGRSFLPCGALGPDARSGPTVGNQGTLV